MVFINCFQFFIKQDWFWTQYLFSTGVEPDIQLQNFV